MMLDASRYWDTETQFNNFGFLRRKIRNKFTDPETKNYAKSIMSAATKRLKNSLKEYGIKMKDKYDMFDFIREWKNIEDGKPAVRKDLYKMIKKNFTSPNSNL